ncbi:MAG TPA: hypothetical protein VHB98_01850 [Chloroflexota bacterium]|jgi:hypothetical protein|nr:hypothetical protein [Chloroflexota bacterium]
MFDSIVQQFSGGSGGVANEALHGGLDTLLSQASSGHVSGAIGDVLQSLGAGGFAQSVQSAAQSQGPNERGQIGSMLLSAIEHGGGNPSGALGALGIGTQNPQQMSHGDLGALAGYVAQNHGSALAGLLGDGAAGGGPASAALHLLGTPIVQQTAEQLARRFL